MRNNRLAEEVDIEKIHSSDADIVYYSRYSRAITLAANLINGIDGEKEPQEKVSNALTAIEKDNLQED